MYEVDYNLLIKNIPEIHKSLLNKIEEYFNLRDLDKAYEALDNYESFKEVMLSNDLYSVEFDDKFKELEKMVLNAFKLDKNLKERIIDNYSKTKYQKN